MQTASTRAPNGLQRRYFRAAGVAYRPPAFAVALKEEEEDSPDQGSEEKSFSHRAPPSRPSPRWGGGWVKTRSPSGLTPEEKALRDELRNQAVRPSPDHLPNPTPPMQSELREDPPRNGDMVQRRSLGEGKRDNLVRAHESESRRYPRRIDFRPKNLTSDEFLPKFSTKSADSFPAQSSQVTPLEQPPRFTPSTRLNGADVEKGQNWMHLPRSSSTTRASSITQEQHGIKQPSRQTSRDAEGLIKVETVQEERQRRLERTRDGKFVGFTRRETGSFEVRKGPGTSGGMGKLYSREPNSANAETSAAHDFHSDLSSAESAAKLSTVVKARGITGKPHTTRDKALPSTNSNRPISEGNASRAGLSKFDPSFLDSETTEPRTTKTSSTQGFPVKGTSFAESESEPLARDHGSTSSAPYERGGSRIKARKGKGFVRELDDYEDLDDRAAKRRDIKEQRKRAKMAQKQAAPPTPIYLPEFISVSNLAGVLKVRIEDFLKRMKDLGFDELSNDHVLDAETAGLIAAEFNFEPVIDRSEGQDLKPRPLAEDKSLIPARPPVVTIMGHVDHGKTTLLDYLRKSSVVASEHGGITQHIGAFSVPMPGGRLVTFLDTPGHAAFLSMRQRGANVTDIVILVVAADDSVKPQTIEAIKHAQAAKVPMIVAVNKIDKEDSNVERVKQDLSRYGVEIEDFGGDTQVVCVSGKTGQGMEELEDAAVALADILDMRAETDGQAEGWVLEATTKKAGRVATVLVRRGTLKPGDVIVAGTSWARVRSLRNEAGAMVPHAGPGTPVEIDGWREQPSAGDEMLQASDEQKAKSVIEYRLEASERAQMAADMAAVNEARRLEQEKRDQLEEAAKLAEANPDAPAESQERSASTAPSFQEVFFIVKADVSGSVEAVTNAVSALGNSEVRPHILRSGVGPITEFDIDHAAVAKGHIISFNTHVEGPIQRMAESKEVKILDQSIIYRLVDDVKATLGAKLPPLVTQRVLGEAEVAQVFEINIKGRATVPVAGCRVRNGVISRTGRVRVMRNKEVVYDGIFPRNARFTSHATLD